MIGGSHLATRALLAATVACAAVACGKPPAEAPAAPAPSQAAGGTAGTAAAAAPTATAAPAQQAPLVGTPIELGGLSKGGKYRIAVRFEVPKVGQLFTVETRVDGVDGAALPQDLTVTVDATMPEHRHGMMTQPTTAAAGPGRWRSEGFKLHMHGKWVFAVTVSQGASTDTLDAPFEQPPEAEEGQ